MIPVTYDYDDVRNDKIEGEFIFVSNFGPHGKPLGTQRMGVLVLGYNAEHDEIFEADAGISGSERVEDSKLLHGYGYRDLPPTPDAVSAVVRRARAFIVSQRPTPDGG